MVSRKRILFITLSLAILSIHSVSARPFAEDSSLSSSEKLEDSSSSSSSSSSNGVVDDSSASSSSSSSSSENSGGSMDADSIGDALDATAMGNNPDSKIGGIRVGVNQALVPDSASDHPLVLSHEEDQPLCDPNTKLEPAQPLKVMNGYESILITNQIKEPRKLIMDRVNHGLVVSSNNAIYSLRMDKCGNVDAVKILDLQQQQGSLFEKDETLAHGLALDTKYLYIATTNNVYQFPYSDGQHSPLENGRKVVSNINPTNKDGMPDVAIDPFGHAFIPRSGVFNLDPGSINKMDQNNAIIKKFNFRNIPENGFDYDSDGLVSSIYKYIYKEREINKKINKSKINKQINSSNNKNNNNSNHNK